MITYFSAFWVLAGINLIVFGLYLHAIAHVRATDKALKHLDWETIANLTGEVGAMKRSLQKVNNRINGMTVTDPAQMLAELPKFSSPQQTNGRMGG
jgi:uncharacterized protein YoxC